MKTKLKKCSLCEQETVIWKQFSGKRYCRNCWARIKPPVQTTAPKSFTPIPKRSAKRIKQEAAYSVLRKVFLDQHPECMAKIEGVCSGDRTHEIHHQHSGKDREKYFLDTGTWLALERSCHDWIHSHPLESRELGLLK